MNIPIAPGLTLTMDSKGTRTAEPTIQERIESARKKCYERHLETVTRQQALEIAEKMEAGAALELKRLLEMDVKRLLEAAPRPVMTEAQHNAFKGGRW